jgi:SAM-dependent methyltransferase
MRWVEVAGVGRGAAYAARFAALAAAGTDVHGEARFCAALVPPPARVLDAGCGTGRVAIRLAELGYDCVGVDADPAMLAEARRTAPALPWVLADLMELDLGDRAGEDGADLVVAAGNVFPFLAPGSGPVVLARLAAHLRPGGLLVSGFGLDFRHLPHGAAEVPLADYDGWCAAAGLEPVGRFATWDGDPYDGGGYAVSVHRRSRAVG